MGAPLRCNALTPLPSAAPTARSRISRSHPGRQPRHSYGMNERDRQTARRGGAGARPRRRKALTSSHRSVPYTNPRISPGNVKASSGLRLLPQACSAQEQRCAPGHSPLRSRQRYGINDRLRRGGARNRIGRRIHDCQCRLLSGVPPLAMV